MAIEAMAIISCLFPLLVSSHNTTVNGTRGERVQWPCKVNLDPLLNQSRIYWQTQSQESPHVVQVFNRGIQDFQYIAQSYQNRTDIFMDQLASGDFSLVFVSLTLKDDGTLFEVIYQPKVGKPQKLCPVALYVAAPFQTPQINLGEETATCNTHGGFPEPRVSWTRDGLELEPDEANLNVTSDPTDGTYSVTSEISIANSQSVTCLVYNPTSNQTIEATQVIPDLFTMQVIVIACCIVAVVVLAGIGISIKKRFCQCQNEGTRLPQIDKSTASVDSVL